MAKYTVDDTSLASVADAIRTKGGTSDAMAFPAGFVAAIESMQTGGGGGVSSGSYTQSGSTRVISVTGLEFTPRGAYYTVNQSYSDGWGFAQDDFTHCGSSGNERTATFTASAGEFKFEAPATSSTLISGSTKKTVYWYAWGDE
jgi:hypothetical protein